DGAGSCWNGASFAAACPNYIAVTSGGSAAGAANANWSYTIGSAAFTDGHTYNVQVQATDATTSGNTSGNLTAGSFAFDTSAPNTASLTTNGVYNTAGWPGAISGTTTDSGTGSHGISAVKVSIQDGAGSCWNGASFAAACPNYIAVTSGGSAAGAANANWSYTIGAASLTDGHTYNVQVQATDAVTNGNVSGNLSAGSFVVDKSAPTTATLTTTGTYDAAGWTGAISGTTTDSGTGSHGISAVKVSIQDGAGSCWNGASFAAACPNYVAVTSGGSAAGAANANWSYNLAVGALTDGHTYTVQVQATDATTSGNTSGNLSAGTFSYDATAPTMTSAVVAADGKTVTVTWSENLDQTQAVAGSAFSISPNGGAGIAGTAAAVSYPAANKTQFVLSSVVHHLDSLALTYTKPGSGAMVRDLAQTPGNASATATLPNASITNSTTNVAPSTPALVTPANAAQLNTTTPTLTATFSDPDTQDTGKVTFQVCSDSACATSIGAFDSSSTNLAVGANGSAAVPGALGLVNGTTYYWRAEDVDSSSATSSFSATRSFTVDTAAPTMTSASVAADGVTVTVTWSENLDQTQAVPGSAFSVTPNGGAAVAGTAAAVTYPAANKTQLVLSSAVHHLDTLSLSYTKPGSTPWVRDTATDSSGTAAGNAAATGTLPNGSITNSTSDAAPSTPVLVTPANAAQVNTTTPTLTATFSDPDTQDTGKVTFQVCADSGCTSSLGTVDS